MGILGRSWFRTFLGSLLLALFGLSLVGVMAVRSIPVPGGDLPSWSGTRYPSVGFVVSCSISRELNDDPIRFPGQPGASHRHTFFGNTSVNAFSTSLRLRNGRTNCNEKADRAAYWLPSPVVGRWNNMRAYYSAGEVRPERLSAYPAGAKVISGTSDREVAWSCGRGVNDVGWTSVAPVCSPKQPLAVRITFGQCITSDGNTGVAAINNECPPDHPILTPLLRLRVEWDGAPSQAKERMLSSGPLESMHADFLNGWDPDALWQLTRVCIRGERKSNREIKQCRLVGTGPTSISQ